jgi:hypothetical protein
MGRVYSSKYQHGLSTVAIAKLIRKDIKAAIYLFPWQRDSP